MAKTSTLLPSWSSTRGVFLTHCCSSFRSCIIFPVSIRMFLITYVFWLAFIQVLHTHNCSIPLFEVIRPHPDSNCEILFPKIYFIVRLLSLKFLKIYVHHIKWHARNMVRMYLSQIYVRCCPTECRCVGFTTFLYQDKKWNLTSKVMNCINNYNLFVNSKS